MDISDDLQTLLVGGTLVCPSTHQNKVWFDVLLPLSNKIESFLVEDEDDVDRIVTEVVGEGNHFVYCTRMQFNDGLFARKELLNQSNGVLDEQTKQTFISSAQLLAKKLADGGSITV